MWVTLTGRAAILIAFGLHISGVAFAVATLGSSCRFRHIPQGSEVAETPYLSLPWAPIQASL